MTHDQAVIARRVINAAKQIERAAQYGVNALAAAAEYDQARAEQTKAQQAQGRAA